MGYAQDEDGQDLEEEPLKPSRRMVEEEREMEGPEGPINKAFNSLEQDILYRLT